MTQAAEATINAASNLIDTLIATNRGDHHAFAYGEKRYSYQDVAALMNRTGNMMRAMGVRPGAKVLLMIPPSPALIASLLGAMKSGAVPVVGVSLDDADALKRCIGATTPSALVIHQAYLASAKEALSTLPAEAVVVVGTDVQGHHSFVDAIRGQSSWFSAEPVDAVSPAIGLWSGSTLRVISHAELAETLAGTGDFDQDPQSDGMRIATLLRAFSKGEEAVLR